MAATLAIVCGLLAWLLFTQDWHSHLWRDLNGITKFLNGS